MQLTQWIQYNAINVMHWMQCNTCGAINAMQWMKYNECNATNDAMIAMQLMQCN